MAAKQKEPKTPGPRFTTIDEIIAKAPALIAAGITSITIDGVAVTLSSRPPAQDAEPPKPVPRAHIDPLKDASTYPGGRVPGFHRERVKGEDEY